MARQTVPVVECDPTVPSLLRHVAARYGDRAFVATPGVRVSFAGIEAGSRRLAGALLEAGLVKGTRVAFRFGNGPEWLTLWLALARIGCISMPLSTMYRPAELRQVLALSDAEVFVTPSQLQGADQAELVEQALPGLAQAAPSPLHLKAVPFLRRVFMVGGDLPVWADPLPEAATDWAETSTWRVWRPRCTHRTRCW